GRKVEDIKSHFSDVVEPFHAILKRAMLDRLGERRTRKHFIPRTVLSSFAVYNHDQFPRISTGTAKVAILQHQMGDSWIEDHIQCLGYAAIQQAPGFCGASSQSRSAF